MREGTESAEPRRRGRVRTAERASAVIAGAGDRRGWAAGSGRSEAVRALVPDAATAAAVTARVSAPARAARGCGSCNLKFGIWNLESGIREMASKFLVCLEVDRDHSIDRND